MATGTILLPIAAAVPSDGTSGNAAPAMVVIQGTDTNPKKHFLAASFDPATAEYVTWSFRMPVDYASAPVLKALFMVNAATGNNVVWACKVAAVTPADADTPVEHVPATVNTVTQAANATEARRLVEASITLTNADSLAAGDLVSLLFYRDAANGSDTVTQDAELVAAALEYTTT